MVHSILVDDQVMDYEEEGEVVNHHRRPIITPRDRPLFDLRRPQLHPSQLQRRPLSPRVSAFTLDPMLWVTRSTYYPNPHLRQVPPLPWQRQQRASHLALV